MSVAQRANGTSQRRPDTHPPSTKSLQLSAAAAVSDEEEDVINDESSEGPGIDSGSEQGDSEAEALASLNAALGMPPGEEDPAAITASQGAAAAPSRQRRTIVMQEPPGTTLRRSIPTEQHHSQPNKRQRIASLRAEEEEGFEEDEDEIDEVSSKGDTSSLASSFQTASGKQRADAKRKDEREQHARKVAAKKHESLVDTMASDALKEVWDLLQAVLGMPHSVTWVPSRSGPKGETSPRRVVLRHPPDGVRAKKRMDSISSSRYSDRCIARAFVRAMISPSFALGDPRVWDIAHALAFSEEYGRDTGYIASKLENTAADAQELKAPEERIVDPLPVIVGMVLDLAGPGCRGKSFLEAMLGEFFVAALSSMPLYVNVYEKLHPGMAKGAGKKAPAGSSASGGGTEYCGARWPSLRGFCQWLMAAPQEEVVTMLQTASLYGHHEDLGFLAAPAPSLQHLGEATEQRPPSKWVWAPDGTVQPPPAIHCIILTRMFIQLCFFRGFRNRALSLPLKAAQLWYPGFPVILQTVASEWSDLLYFPPPMPEDSAGSSAWESYKDTLNPNRLAQIVLFAVSSFMLWSVEPAMPIPSDDIEVKQLLSTTLQRKPVTWERQGWLLSDAAARTLLKAVHRRLQWHTIPVPQPPAPGQLTPDAHSSPKYRPSTPEEPFQPSTPPLEPMEYQPSTPPLEPADGPSAIAGLSLPAAAVEATDAGSDEEANGDEFMYDSDNERPPKSGSSDGVGGQVIVSMSLAEPSRLLGEPSNSGSAAGRGGGGGGTRVVDPTTGKFGDGHSGYADALVRPGLEWWLEQLQELLQAVYEMYLGCFLQWMTMNQSLSEEATAQLGGTLGRAMKMQREFPDDFLQAATESCKALTAAIGVSRVYEKFIRTAVWPLIVEATTPVDLKFDLIGFSSESLFPLAIGAKQMVMHDGCFVFFTLLLSTAELAAVGLSPFRSKFERDTTSRALTQLIERLQLPLKHSLARTKAQRESVAAASASRSLLTLDLSQPATRDEEEGLSIVEQEGCAWALTKLAWSYMWHIELFAFSVRGNVGKGSGPWTGVRDFAPIPPPLWDVDDLLAMAAANEKGVDDAFAVAAAAVAPSVAVAMLPKGAAALLPRNEAFDPCPVMITRLQVYQAVKRTVCSAGVSDVLEAGLRCLQEWRDALPLADAEAIEADIFAADANVLQPNVPFEMPHRRKLPARK